jgi:hypothetical protein
MMSQDDDTLRGKAGRGRAAGTLLLTIPLLVAIVGGCAQAQEATTAPTTTAPPATSPPEDFVAEATDFVNLKDMTAVRGFFIANHEGHLDETLAVANDPAGGRYPVGTIVQLIPQEAMVKRRAGFDPASNDWEFFELDTSATGTVIHKRGGSEVVNRFGGNSCSGCHKMAEARFDFVCETTHGCDPLPIPDSVFLDLQAKDARPRKPA